MRRRPFSATRKAGVTLGLGYNRTVPSGNDEASRAYSLGRTWHGDARRSDDDISECSSAETHAVASSSRRNPCGGLTPMGVHAIDGMIDLCGDIDQVFCQSFRRVVEIDADDTTSVLVSDERWHVGLSGNYHGHGTGLQLSGFRIKRLGTSGWHDARGGRVVGRKTNALVRHLQVPADKGARGSLASGDPGCDAGGIGIVCKSSRRAGRRFPFRSSR